MQFEQWMLGARVREIDTGDEGIVIDDSWHSGVLVRWLTGEDKGSKLAIGCKELEYLDTPQTPQEIVINGKRYKLVPIEEE